jgi:hypothetical protein
MDTSQFLLRPISSSLIPATVMTLLTTAERSVSVRLRGAAATLPRTEAILPVVIRLSNGEFRIGSSLWGLSFGTR